MVIRAEVIGALSFILTVAGPLWADPRSELDTGLAQHAFDHAGNMSQLAGPAAACGSTIIYCTGVGADGYLGLPGPEKLADERRNSLAYLKQARAQGIHLAIGYVCATSIVKVDSFDRNWTAPFRAQFHTPPAQWRQLDRSGHPLPSWYGAPYEPACMNNPDWRAYEKFMVRQQLQSGCDGIFFDNPTVHQDGCYCPFCMEKFDAFLAAKPAADRPAAHSPQALRRWAVEHPADFRQFRSIIASDFLAEMRAFARTIKARALVTCNNSLNSPDALFSQCRALGYNIDALSQVEDYLLVEDMGSQAREPSGGGFSEYGPTYRQLHAISHGKPIVACTLADADYHASPDLARLSMAEAAANDASWLLWPDWPENLRAAMAQAIRPEADFLRHNEKLLNHTEPRCDALLFLCYRRWLETDRCAASAMAAALTQANIQYSVCSEESLPSDITSARRPPVLLIESKSVPNAVERQAVEKYVRSGGQVVAADESNWMETLRRTIEKPSITLHAPAQVRAVVRDQPRRVILHLYNLGVERISSFQDRVHPVEQIGISLRVPFPQVRSIRALTADNGSTHGALEYSTRRDAGESVIEMTCPKLEISTLLVIEP